MPTFYSNRPPTVPATWLRRTAAVFVAVAMVVAVGVGVSALERATRATSRNAGPARGVGGVPAPPRAQAILDDTTAGRRALRRYVSESTPQDIAHFYRISLLRQGWRETEPFPAELKGTALAFARRGQLCIISLDYSKVNPGTTVTVFILDTRGSGPARPPYEEKRP